MDVAIGATTNEVVSKFGKPIEVYDDSRDKVLYYDFSVDIDPDSNKVTYMSLSVSFE